MKLTKQWYALLTRSRFENVVHDKIMQKSINVFLPKIKVKSQRKDRNKMLHVPLFPGYVFVNIPQTPQEQLRVLKTMGAVRLLGYKNGPVAIPDNHIESLKIITGSGLDIITGSGTNLARGDTVLVVHGPMTGATGEFIQYKGKGRVIIKIEALGQFAGVEIDEQDVEKTDHILT
jgi:transcription antitermination factor NusG